MPSIVFWEWLRTGRFESHEGSDSVRMLRLRAAQSRQRVKLVRRAKEKAGDRAIRYEFHYDDEKWNIYEYNKIIDGLLDYAHKEWAGSDADEAGPMGREGVYWLRISVVDVPVMR